MEEQPRTELPLVDRTQLPILGSPVAERFEWQRDASAQLTCHFRVAICHELSAGSVWSDASGE